MTTALDTQTAAASQERLAQPQTDERNDLLRDGVAVALPTLLALALSLYDITARSIGFDEAASVTIAAQHGSAFGSAIAHDGGNMSGYYSLLRVVESVFGNGLLAVRLPSAIAAAVAVAALSVLALRLFDRRVALMAGLLSAVSLPLIFWAQAARGYAPMVALVSLSFLALTVLVQRAQEGRALRGPWIAYVVCTALAGYMSFAAALIVPAQLLVVMFLPRVRRAAILAVLATAACWVPLVVLAVDRGSGQLFWVPGPSHNAQQVLESLTSAALRPSFASTSTTPALIGLTLVLLVAVAATIIRGLAPAPGSRRPRAPDAWRPALMLSWLLVPVLLAWLESLAAQPVFLPRNLLIAAPAMAVLLAWGLAHPRLPRALGWTLLVAVLGLRALQLAPTYGDSPEAWRAVTSYVLARAQQRDCIAFYPADGRMAFQYYVGTTAASVTRAPRAVLPAAPWGQVRPYVEDYATLSRPALSGIAHRCRQLWLVASHEGQRRGPADSRANYARYRRLRGSLSGVYAGHRITSFGRAAVIRVELFRG